MFSFMFSTRLRERPSLTWEVCITLSTLTAASSTPSVRTAQLHHNKSKSIRMSWSLDCNLLENLKFQKKKIIIIIIIIIKTSNEIYETHIIANFIHSHEGFTDNSMRQYFRYHGYSSACNQILCQISDLQDPNDQRTHTLTHTLIHNLGLSSSLGKSFLFGTTLQQIIFTL